MTKKKKNEPGIVQINQRPSSCKIARSIVFPQFKSILSDLIMMVSYEKTDGVEAVPVAYVVSTTGTNYELLYICGYKVYDGISIIFSPPPT